MGFPVFPGVTIIQAWPGIWESLFSNVSAVLHARPGYFIDGGVRRFERSCERIAGGRHAEHTPARGEEGGRMKDEG